MKDIALIIVVYYSETYALCPECDIALGQEYNGLGLYTLALGLYCMHAFKDKRHIGLFLSRQQSAKTVLALVCRRPH